MSSGYELYVCAPTFGEASVAARRAAALLCEIVTVQRAGDERLVFVPAGGVRRLTELELSEANADARDESTDEHPDHQWLDEDYLSAHDALARIEDVLPEYA